MDKQDVSVQVSLALAEEPAEPSEQDWCDPDEDTDSWDFDYISPEHRAVVGKATQVVHTAMTNIVANIFEIGQQLNIIKNTIEHGQFRIWMAWIQDEFGLKERMAQRYMNVYRRFGKRADISRQLKPTALYHLAAPSTPEEAIATVQEMIQAGDRLTVQEVIDIIAVCRRATQNQDENRATYAARLARSFRKALTALDNRTVEDCERVLGDEATERLGKVRVELEELLAQVHCRLPTAQPRPTKMWTVVAVPVPPARVQEMGADETGSKLQEIELVQGTHGKDAKDERVVPGCTVSFLEGNASQEAHYTLVTDEPGDPDTGRLNWESPVAQALQGKRVGDIATAYAPNGEIQLVITGIRLPDDHPNGSRKDSQTEMMQFDTTPRPARSALTSTGGFLEGFTHTLNPYVGCGFGCDYCYVKGSPVHLFHQPRRAWGEYAHPRHGIAERLEKELARFAAKDELDRLSIFMSSATDPYQGVERRFRLTRACLDGFSAYPPGLLVVQTRSPLVEDDFDRLQTLGTRCWLNVTLETDVDEVRQAITPRCPSVARRLLALQRAQEAGLNVQITVSPCLPFSSVETFGALLVSHSHRVIVDTFASGDGAGGKRTAKTDTPAIYAAQGWGDWRDEQAARALYQWLQAHIGDRAGWSQAGFTALAKQRSVCE